MAKRNKAKKNRTEQYRYLDENQTIIMIPKLTISNKELLAMVTSILDNIKDIDRSNDSAKDSLTALQTNRYLVEFAERYIAGTISNDKLIKRLITEAKGAYEYAESRIMFDELYDVVLERYLKNSDNVEPNPSVPAVIARHKVGVMFPELHNNMDKAYRIRTDDGIPSGVRESKSIQSFLETAGDGKYMLRIAPKIDGVSVVASVKNGKIVSAQTRGDDDLAISLPGLEGYDLGYDTGKIEGIQFECYLTKSMKDRLNKDTGNNYVSCRSATAAVVSRLATTLDTGYWKYVKLYPINTTMDKFSDTHKFLESLPVLADHPNVYEDMPECRYPTYNTASHLMFLFKHLMTQMAQRESYDVEFDGFVLSIVDEDIIDKLGRSGRTNKWQIAFKTPPRGVEAIISDVTYDISDKGYRVPRLHFEKEVSVSGATYNSVPVIDLTYFNENDVRIGSVITVYRVGDTIPSYVLTKSGKGDKIKLIDKCPICDGDLSIRSGKLHCSNVDCSGNIVGTFSNMIKVLDLKGYGPAMAMQLYTDLGCRSIGSVLSISDKEIEKKVPVGFDKLIKFIETLKAALKSNKTHKIIAALNLPGIGKEKAKLLLQHYPLGALAELTPETANDIATRIVGDSSGYLVTVLLHDNTRSTIRNVLQQINT